MALGAGEFVIISVDESIDRLRHHQVVLERVQCESLDRIATDGDLIGTGSAAAGVRTGQIILADGGQAGSADAAGHQSGQKVLGAAVFPITAFSDSLGDWPGLDLTEAFGDAIPKGLIDDPKVRDRHGNDLIGRVRPRNPSARIGIFDVSLAIPDPLADVQPVAQDAAAPCSVTAQCCVGPGFAARAGHTVSVQLLGDGQWRFAGRETLEDPADDLGLAGVDPEIPPDPLAPGVMLDHHFVSVAQAATGLAGEDPSFQTAMGLLGEILELEGVHRALEADMEFVDDAFRPCVNGYTLEFGALEEVRDVGLVAGQPIEGLGDDRVHGAGLDDPQEVAIAGAQMGRRPRNPRVLADPDDLEPLILGQDPAQPDLVVD